ncbi:hypothetical protein B0H19DRAFT_1225861 [Mycena capillaripes]|nr:hypothetical protein B0H19DRAFT_1225861 [Mycena capillaripes]
MTWRHISYIREATYASVICRMTHFQWGCFFGFSLFELLEFATGPSDFVDQPAIVFIYVLFESSCLWPSEPNTKLQFTTGGRSSRVSTTNPHHRQVQEEVGPVYHVERFAREYRDGDVSQEWGDTLPQKRRQGLQIADARDAIGINDWNEIADLKGVEPGVESKVDIAAEFMVV